MPSTGDDEMELYEGESAEEPPGGLYFEEVTGDEQVRITRADASYEPDVFLSFQEIRDLEQKYVLQTYARTPVAFAYGSGEFLYDDHGHEFIDFLSGIAVTSVGHAHADLIAAVTRQAERVWHTSNLFYTQPMVQLARALVELSFPGKVFFCNSGTEANEAAVKLIRAWGYSQSRPKPEIIALRNSFHGRTFAAMSVTGQDKVQSGFGPLLDDIIFIEPNDIAGLEAAFSEDTAGIIFEPMLGEGGVLPMTPDFIRRARELADQHQALMVLDEVQTGIGRTGKYFCYEHYGILPDAVTLAKGLGGGIPIGAMIVSDRFADVLHAGMHGTTFGGNPLACAVAYEVLRVIESHRLLENAAIMGNYLSDGLTSLSAKYPVIREVRGKGLLIGIELDGVEARPLVSRALDLRLIIGRASDNVLRLAPPLVLREATAARALERIEKLIAGI